MSAKGFVGAALASALELGVASPDDIIKHVTPDLLAAHLPRSLWARLFTACLGAARVDATLIVDTVGIPNLCEHVPLGVLWACLAELSTRALGGAVAAAPKHAMTGPGSKPLEIATPPPAQEPARSTPPPAPALGPSIPGFAAGSGSGSDDLVDERPTPSAPSRGRTPTSQRFRSSATGLGRGGSAAPAAPIVAAASAAQRRPQATATAADGSPLPGQRRVQTETQHFDAETDVGAEAGGDDWKSTLAVDDEQLVDWTAADDPARR